MAAAEVEGILWCGRRGEEREGDDVEGVVGEGGRRRGCSSRQGDDLGCRRERQQGAQQEDGRRRRQPVEEVGSHGASMRHGEGVKTCGCGCVCVCLGRVTVVLGRRSGGVRAVAVASDRKARRLAGSRREERRREDEAKLSNREWSYDALRFKKALARN